MNAPETDIGPPVGDVVGASLPRRESVEKVTGTTLYTDDMKRPGMLFGAVLGSSCAHARIRGYDIAAARALPGVKAVLTGADVPANRIGTFLKDQYILARDKVRYLGEPVAAVAAVDIETARAALRLIDIDYEELPAVFDPQVALGADAPVLHEERAQYECLYELPEPANATSLLAYEEGDADAAFAECDVVIEDECLVPAQNHMYMEPVSSLAEIDGSGKLTVWSSCQGVSRVQMMVAAALGMPMSKVRAIGPAVGGGFGGKGDLTNQGIAAALALATRRPVRLTMTRDEDMTTMRHRHAGRIRIKTGARKDGTLLARRADIILDGGAYSDESPAVGAFAAYFARGPYRIAHSKIECWVAYTNVCRAGAFRGFGNPQITFAAETQIDAIAARLGIDPIELRLKNALQTGDKWLGGQTVHVGSLGRCLEAVRKASDWDARRRAPNAARAGKKRGLGVAAFAHESAFLSAAAAVRLNEDGTVTVNTGAQDIGQGCDTALAQIAAGSFGLGIDQVNYVTPDSDSAPYNFQTAGSRNTYMVGGAIVEASARVKEKMYAAAAEMLECSAEDLETRPGGWIGIKGVPPAQLPFAAIAGRGLYAKGGPISGTHDWLFPAEHFDPKRCRVRGFNMTAEVGIFCFGAQVAEVEVDELTGQVEVLQVWAAHDVGRAINPQLLTGQIEGAVVQGLGYGLVEEMLWEDGRVVNPSMMDYKIFGSVDAPPRIHSIVIEEAEPTGPFGAKGVGEIALVGPASAVTNAIFHATGARVRQIPATPERVLAAIGER